MKWRCIVLLSALFFVNGYSQFSTKWIKQTEILAENGTFLGCSVAMSADGKTAVAGGWGDNAANGAIWIFKLVNNLWLPYGPKITLPLGGVPGAAMGQAVAISGDGKTILAGAPQEGMPAKGAVFVFTLSNDNWIQQGPPLCPLDATNNAMFGYSAALSYDGNTAVVGCFGDDNGRGAFWIFTRVGNNWIQQGPKHIAAGDIGSAWQGCSVDISGDGNTIIAGGYKDNFNIGAAWVFVKNRNLWVQEAKLCGNNHIGQSGEGYSVALSYDGNTAVVGGKNDNNNLGAAWIFSRKDGFWSDESEKLTCIQHNPGNVFFGQSVDISGDGNTILVGGADGGDNFGAVWTFIKDNSTWTQYKKKLTCHDNVLASSFGSSVSLSDDGFMAVAGGPSDNISKGAVWPLKRFTDISSWTAEITPNSAYAQTSNNFTITCRINRGFTDDGTILFGLPDDWIIAGVSSNVGTAYVTNQFRKTAANQSLQSLQSIEETHYRFIGVENLSLSEGDSVIIKLENTITGSALGANDFFTLLLPSEDADLCPCRKSPSVFLYANNPATARYQITKPEAGNIVNGGQYNTIEWRRIGGVIQGALLLEYSTDNGATWNRINTAPIAGIMKYSWLTPNVNSERCKLRLCNYLSHKVFDETKGVFSIKAASTAAKSYPNPFNPSTTIKFGMTESGFTTLKIYNGIGQQVAELVNRQLEAGEHSFIFDASLLPSGVYYYILKCGNRVETNKLLLIK
jgi:hypothetical protein